MNCTDAESGSRPKITTFILMLLSIAVAGESANGVQLEFETELTSLNQSGYSSMPLASDPGNALGDSISGYGFVDSQVSVTLSSQRPISPGPRSFGAACTDGPPSCSFPGSPPNIDPDVLDGEEINFSSFFDVYFDITFTDVDLRPGRDYAGWGPGGVITFQNNSDSGTRDAISNYQATFDKDVPNYGLLLPPEDDPYIGFFNIEILVGGDINGNGENDKIKITLGTIQINEENRTFLTLPDGSVVNSFDAEMKLFGAVVDISTDPPFEIRMNGPGSAESKLLNLVPEPNGDFNNDGHIDARDYVVWRNNNGSAADYDAWRANYANGVNDCDCSPVGSGTSNESASVPEPSTLCLLAVGAISLLGRRKR